MLWLPMFHDYRITFQVQYLGLLENLLVHRKGYCFRATFADFVNRFKLFSDETWLSREANPEVIRSILSTGTKKDWNDQIKELPAFRFQEDTDYVFGKTMVFIKVSVGYEPHVTLIQRLVPLTFVPGYVHTHTHKNRTQRPCITWRIAELIYCLP